MPLNQLQWWIDNSIYSELEEGEFLFKSGDPVVGTHVIIKGRLRVFVPRKKGVKNIESFEEKTVTGHLPFSRGQAANVDAQVAERAQVMTFPVAKMKQLIEEHFELNQALVHVMTSRVRDFTTMQQQNEKMMALGKLSAGLAHELNNPASAIVRGSVSLKKHLQLEPETCYQFSPKSHY